MAPIRVLLSGGGTGGHLVPGLNLARSLLEHGDSAVLVRTGRAVESPFLHDVPGMEVDTIALKGRGLALPFAISRKVGPARRMIDERGIDVVVGLGGAGSLPCVFAAWTRRVPFVLFEQNVVPGRANRFTARFAQRIYTAFSDTQALLPGRPVACTGMPLRDDLGGPPDRKLLRRFAVEGRLVLLVVGGSQGAEALNLHVPPLLASLGESVRERLAVIHIAGAGKEAQTAEAYTGTGIEVHILAFSNEMPSLYSIADVVICRGGGTSLVEVAAAGKPAVVVPFPWHRDHHQERNARWFASRGACRVVDQATLTAGGGGDEVGPLLADAGLRRTMAARASAALPRDAGSRIVADLREIVAGGASLPGRRAVRRERVG